jgi:hypothetical protein
VTEDEAKPAPLIKTGKMLVEPGKPLQLIGIVDVATSSVELASLDRSIGKTLVAYHKAARALLEGKYTAQRDLAPPYMGAPCNIYVLRCTDGILVRYDLSSEEKGTLVCANLKINLAEAAPKLSEQVIHFPDDPKTYIPSPGGVEIILAVADPTTGALAAGLKVRPLIYASTKLPDTFQFPLPPARPPCFVSIQNEIDLQLHGVVAPSDALAEMTGSKVDQFIAHGRCRLPVGWQTIEIYPPLSEDYWKPEYAPIWAEMDLLAVIAQKNAIASSLIALDGRGATRKRYSAILAEFKALLDGPEEPVHQFLKQHPELLCPTHERFWSKLAFGEGQGKRVSDFVFREPHNDYLLVEIEAPYRELFRKDGQQREELTHAINQIMDWIQYIGKNKQKVEDELTLTGISTNPRTLVVIGRSGSLTNENRTKLATLQAQQNKLRILTYDDLFAAARANLERILGPLDLQGENVQLYYYKVPDPSLTAGTGQ